MKKSPDVLKDWVEDTGRRWNWLCERVGVAPSTMARWAAGQTIPDRANREKLCEVTGLDILDEAGWLQ